ncbi:MAG: Fe-S cluster assembly protein SufB, partial [Rickettsiales bacterium]|nr:Fe-S cluster assembly protein SufB [Rickettsiales bacterium]
MKLSEDLIKKISAERLEPDWMLDIRVRAFNKWKKMAEPHWAGIDYEPIDYDNLNYFNNPSKIDNNDLAAAYKKMGIPESEQKALLGMAVDTVIDSKSVHTSYTEELNRLGIIFLPFSEAVQKHPDLVREYFGSSVPIDDNFFAVLNTAVFSDGTFVYIPENVKCPIDLASYFRIETARIGQFERTLIIADKGAELSYMEGCSAPRRPNHQLHSGVVEVIVKDSARVKYATVQNWADNIYNFVTKRAKVESNAKMFWTQVEIGSAKTWKYPSSVLYGEGAFSDFYSLSITKGVQQADTGTRMIHIGPNTKSNIVSFGVADGEPEQTFRSMVRFHNRGAVSACKCESKIIGKGARANTVPVFVGTEGNFTHEAT